LYILGDLFEYWIGNDSSSTSVRQIKVLLRNLKQRHIEWFFLSGNRDFLLNKQFLRETHGIMLPEKTLITLDGKRILLLHGDTLCTHDLAYQAFRRQVNKKWLQRLFLSLPFFVRKKLTKKMREKSTVQGKLLDDKMMDVAEEAVTEDFDQFQAEIMIHGHVHRPGIHLYQQQQCRYVLADWDRYGNYLCYEHQQFTLGYFIVRKETSPFK
jgi:UDP-2,3-diacylglucosamine hydrolase